MLRWINAQAHNAWITHVHWNVPAISNEILELIAMENISYTDEITCVCVCNTVGWELCEDVCHTAAAVSPQGMRGVSF